MRRHQPRAQFLDRGPSTLGDIGADCRIERLQLGRLPALLRTRRPLSRGAPPRQCFRYVGNAHLKLVSNLTNSIPIVRRREHTLTQILRIRLAPPIQHSRLRSSDTGDPRITYHPRFGSPDSTRAENALDGNAKASINAAAIKGHKPTRQVLNALLEGRCLEGRRRQPNTIHRLDVTREPW